MILGIAVDLQKYTFLHRFLALLMSFETSDRVYQPIDSPVYLAALASELQMSKSKMFVKKLAIETNLMPAQQSKVGI